MDLELFFDDNNNNKTTKILRRLLKSGEVWHLKISKIQDQQRNNCRLSVCVGPRDYKISKNEYYTPNK